MKLFISAFGAMAVLAATPALALAQPVNPTATAGAPAAANPMTADMKAKPMAMRHKHHHKHRHHLSHKAKTAETEKAMTNAPDAKTGPAADK